MRIPSEGTASGRDQLWPAFGFQWVGWADRYSPLQTAQGDSPAPNTRQRRPQGSARPGDLVWRGGRRGHVRAHPAQGAHEQGRRRTRAWLTAKRRSPGVLRDPRAQGGLPVRGRDNEGSTNPRGLKSTAGPSACVLGKRRLRSAGSVVGPFSPAGCGRSYGPRLTVQHPGMNCKKLARLMFLSAVC